MRRFYPAILLSCVLILSGCELAVMGVAAPMIIQQKRVNLLNASYAAAETLSQQAGKRFSKEARLRVSDLQEVIDMEQKTIITNPKVGRVLAEQMRARFVQLGYNVIDDEAEGEVSGTYEFLHDVMTVSLAMTDKKTGRTITTYSYSLPVTYDIKQYMSGSANMLPPLL